MNDKQLNERFAQIAAELTALRTQLLVTRHALTSLAATHPDKAALAANFAQVAENAIAHTLGHPYSDQAVEAIRKEYEWLRKFLDKNAESDERNNP